MNESNKTKVDYSQNVNALHGLDERNKIRTKMGMYAGGNDIKALHVLLREPTDNSIDEWNYKNFDKLVIKIDSKNNICYVRDYGRGIPYVKDENGISVLNKAISILHMGGKHDNNSKHLLEEKIEKFKGNYQFSSGINGVGVTLCNYSSNYFYAIVFNEQKKEKAYVVYENGFLKEDKLVKINEGIDIYTKEIDSYIFKNDNKLIEDIKTGTLIVFQPSIKKDAFDDDGVFEENINFNKDMIIKQLKTLPYLNPGLKIELFFDEELIIFEKQKEFKDIIKNENKAKLVFKETLYFKEHIIFAQNKETKATKVFSLGDFIKESYEFRQKQNIKETIFEIAFNFIEGSTQPFQENNVNGSIIISGGRQDIQFKTKLLQYINEYLDEIGKKIGKFDKEDVVGNLSFMFQVKINEPKFAGQTKDRLDNSELIQFSNYFFKKYLKYWINREDKNLMDKLIKILEANRKARLAVDKIKDDVFKEILNESDDNLLSNTTKLTKCKSKDPNMCELYLAEGDSAKGPIKDSRVDEYQAVLPLKGKLLNVLKTKDISKVIKNDEIINLITALGCGIDKKFDYNKLQYNKIILMADSDVDGQNIKNLNLIFFYRFYRKLIEKGHIYIVDAPLYLIKTTKKDYYAWDSKERDDIISKINGKFEITRYKGLGEMNPEQLYETCLNKKNRKIYQVQLSDFEKLKPIISFIDKNEIIEEDGKINESLYEELIHIYMNDEKDHKAKRSQIIDEYYSIPKKVIIKLESPVE